MTGKRITTMLWPVGAAATFAAAWQVEWWLVVVSMSACAISVVACERLGEATVAHRVAAWAMYAPAGLTEGRRLEQAIAADLASAAVSDPAVLEAGAVHADHAIDDPWLRSLVAERLLLAQTVASEGDLPAARSYLSTFSRSETRGASAGAVGALAVAAAATRNELLLVPLPIAIAIFAIGSANATRRRRLPALLCGEAATAPVQGLLVMPEPAVVASLVSLASARGRVLAQAAVLVGRHRPHGDVALARLHLATRAVPPERHPGTAKSVVRLAAASAVATLVLEVL